MEQQNQREPKVADSFHARYKHILIPLASMFTFALSIAINALAGVGVLNGVVTGDISDSRPNKFTPASYAFSIWSLIYISLGLYCIYGLLPWSYHNKVIVNKIGYWLAINFLFNTIWVICWQWSVWALTLVFMFAILGSLIIIYLRVGIDYIGNLGNKLSDSENQLVQIWQYWIFQFPISIYMGWISVASIANVSLVFADASAFRVVTTSDSSWSAAMQVVAALLALAMLYLRRDVVFSSVVVWALFAIAARHDKDPRVYITAQTLAVVVLVATVLAAFNIVFHYFKTKSTRSLLALVRPGEKREDEGPRSPAEQGGKVAAWDKDESSLSEELEVVEWQY